MAAKRVPSGDGIAQFSRLLALWYFSAVLFLARSPPPIKKRPGPLQQLRAIARHVVELGIYRRGSHFLHWAGVSGVVIGSLSVLKRISPSEVAQKLLVPVLL